MSRADSSIRLLPAYGRRAELAIDGPASATWNSIIRAETAYEGGDGNAITLAAVADGTWVACAGTLTLAGNAVEDETVTIGSTVYRWRDTLAQAYDVKIGASASASIDNLIAAINANGTPGTHYFAGTLIHPTVRAYAGAGDTMVVHSRPEVTAAAGTLIASTETMTQGSWGATTLGDGTDGTNVTFDVSGTAITCHFASGFSTVEDFEDALAADEDVAALVELKTAGTTPLYLLVVTDDDFSATNLSGGGVATNAAPSSLTDRTLGRRRPFYADDANFWIRNLSGSGSMTATPVLWGFSQASGAWHVVKKPNGGSAIAETSDDGISYAERLSGLGPYSDYYLELESAGTDQTFEAGLDFVRPGAIA